MRKILHAMYKVVGRKNRLRKTWVASMDRKCFAIFGSCICSAAVQAFNFFRISKSARISIGCFVRIENETSRE